MTVQVQDQTKPQTPLSPSSQSKRKAVPAVELAFLSRHSPSIPSSESETPHVAFLAQDVASAKKLKLSETPKAPEPSVASLDPVKATISIKQKSIGLCEVSNSVKKELVAVTEQLEASHVQHLDWEPAQLSLIACIVHESDKALPELVQHVHSKLLPQSELEDDNNVKSFDPLPAAAVESAITSVAHRVNYAPQKSDVDWLPESLPKNLQIWRWEANDRASVIPSELQEIFERRWEERQLIKPQLCALFRNLNASEREAFTKKLSTPRRKARSSTAATSISKPSSTSGPIQQPSQNCTSSPSISNAHKARPDPTSEMLVEDQPAPSAKEVARQQKEQKRREKEEAKEAEEQQKKKMGNMLSGWISKAAGSASKPLPNRLAEKNLPSDGCDKVSPILGSESQSLSVEDQKLSDFDKSFKPFNVKSNMFLAPVNRFSCSPSCDLNQNDSADSSSSNPLPTMTPREYLQPFLASVSCRSPSQPEASRIISVRDVVNGIAECEISGSVEEMRRWKKILQNRTLVPVKLLRYHEDVRPGYVGTWSKISRLVSGRNPYGKDTCLLDYEYDSEADWAEEDAEGEDLAGSEHGDDCSSDVAESDEDGWLVGDEDEIEMVDDVAHPASDPDPAADPTLDDQLESKRMKKITAHSRRKITGPLIPVVKGPAWEKCLGEVPLPMFENMRVQFINDAYIGMNPLTFVPASLTLETSLKAMKPAPKSRPAILPLPVPSTVPTPLAPLPFNISSLPVGHVDPVPTSHMSSGLKMLGGKSPKHPFPAELVPKLLTLVNGNRKAKPILLEDLRVAFLEHRISKKAIERKLGDVAVKVGGVWRLIDQASAEHLNGNG